ncbi:phospho-sugar mutase [Vagococcus vulneris]|uniref:Phosphoglucomutase n=1 Tax=Vagococcus vulneris TaxID=1977869 RepID=A0A430A1X3_9ENTE|nr:phospho-sugar mutase [Vagococcus vulneris]RSU00441.1 phosphoglucomutase [Vagococcus vulneris]
MAWKAVYEQWRQTDNLGELVLNDLKIIENNEDLIKDAFYAPLEFGTAGMRGIIGAGINRMNIYTVRQAAEGLALFIDSQNETAKKRGVAIAYDCRHQSPEFAMAAAETLAAHGIRSFVFESLRPTPELSFAVRELNCAAGIMITASHNPSDYNGFKVYGEDGGQMPPEAADAVTAYVRSIENPLEIEVVSQEKAPDYITIIGEDLDKKYLEQIKTVTINKRLISDYGKNLKLIFTPLHGTGKMLGERALRQAGFDSFEFVEAQAIADPNFSTVVSPNPEEHAAFEYAIKQGKETGADVLIATDPDADRLGAAVRLPNGEYQVLTGNQLGSIMLHYILSAKNESGQLAQNTVALKSIVSSELPAKICQKFDVDMIDVLTGFKFIAEKIKEYEQTGEKEFVFGFEESYGYLIKPFARDKDAIQALVLLAEIATFYKSKGQSLFDGLQEIYKEFGFYIEKTISKTFKGIEGIQKIKDLMSAVRENKPVEFGGIPVAAVEDYSLDQVTYSSGHVNNIGLPKANVLKFKLTNGSWIAIRPSGTEPKIKFYIGVNADSEIRAQEIFDAILLSVNELSD